MDEGIPERHDRSGGIAHDGRRAGTFGAGVTIGAGVDVGDGAVLEPEQPPRAQDAEDRSARRIAQQYTRRSAGSARQPSTDAWHASSIAKR
jgi:hypothetical protein